MSNKINISRIIIDHFSTFVDTDDNISYLDYFIFLGIPLIIGIISVLSGYSISAEAQSTLVNFGSITTALLLSVLVLVYDQDRKYEEKKSIDKLFDRKKKLFKQTYSNICYAVTMSVFLVIACLLSIVFIKAIFTIHIYTFNLSVYFITPLIFFIATNLLLTILMITKRIYVILTLN